MSDSRTRVEPLTQVPAAPAACLAIDARTNILGQAWVRARPRIRAHII